MKKVVFADTFYWVAMTLPDDPWTWAVLRVGAEIGRPHLVTTDEVLTEFLAHLSSRGPYFRKLAVRLVRSVLNDEDVTVIPQSRASFLRGLDLFERRLDKGYSLVDCISMSAMRGESIIEVFTNDRHFAQEGFRPLI
ncbi:MAG: PIN domain-containing protein [Acidobacteria bacterium]|nr:PIN domain-containing protein [Acidobacteriota bacterium]